MKPMNQIKMDAIVDSHRRKLMNGAMIIQMLSMLIQIVCLVGIFTDTAHSEAYCIAFTFVSVTALFGILANYFDAVSNPIVYGKILASFEFLSFFGSIPFLWKAGIEYKK